MKIYFTSWKTSGKFISYVYIRILVCKKYRNGAFGQIQNKIESSLLQEMFLFEDIAPA